MEQKTVGIDGDGIPHPFGGGHTLGQVRMQRGLPAEKYQVALLCRVAEKL